MDSDEQLTATQTLTLTLILSLTLTLTNPNTNPNPNPNRQAMDSDEELRQLEEGRGGDESPEELLEAVSVFLMLTCVANLTLTLQIPNLDPIPRVTQTPPLTIAGSCRHQPKRNTHIKPCAPHFQMLREEILELGGPDVVEAGWSCKAPAFRATRATTPRFASNAVGKQGFRLHLIS